jgi:5-(carboxyamino)imidazole ribonucleotide synthase
MVTDLYLNKKIGILGGGQLGKMLCQSGSKLGLDLSILEKDHSYPAYPICSNWTNGDITDFDDVFNFGKDKDVITIEIENVNIEALKALETLGKEVYPSTEALSIIRDKGLQKCFYKDNGFPSSKFVLFESKTDVLSAYHKGELSIPFVQKSRKEGYDGKGVQVIQESAEIDTLIDASCLVEELVDIKSEISVIVARNPNGEMVHFPPVEMEFHPTANLVEFLYTPSSLHQNILQGAIDLAKNVAIGLNVVGLLAVELFVTTDDKILINEVAPRPHNSGHHTIEACNISQYDMHLRSILNLPLYDPELIYPAVMINLLGEKGYHGDTWYEGIANVLSLNGVYPHLYGKKTTKPYRKMGHVTIVNADLDKAKNIGRQIKNSLKVISKT